MYNWCYHHISERDKTQGGINMTADKVRLFFAGKGLADRITVRDKVSDTAEHSAAVIGCDIGRLPRHCPFYRTEKSSSSSCPAKQGR